MQKVNFGSKGGQVWYVNIRGQQHKKHLSLSPSLSPSLSFSLSLSVSLGLSLYLSPSLSLSLFLSSYLYLFPSYLTYIPYTLRPPSIPTSRPHLTLHYYMDLIHIIFSSCYGNHAQQFPSRYIDSYSTWTNRFSFCSYIVHLYSISYIRLAAKETKSEKKKKKNGMGHHLAHLFQNHVCFASLSLHCFFISALHTSLSHLIYLRAFFLYFYFQDSTSFFPTCPPMRKFLSLWKY